VGLNILLTGVTGYVGSVLAPRLLRDGHSVRGFARDPSRARLEGVPVLAGDAVSGEGLAEALEGIDVAYFLIHSMEPATTAAGAFPARERQAAETFAGSAQAAGLERLGQAMTITEHLDPSICVPAPGQGIIALQCREEYAFGEQVAAAGDEPAAVMADLERWLARLVGATCTTPFGALATASNGVISIRSWLLRPDGTAARAVVEGGFDQRERLPPAAAERLLAPRPPRFM